MATFSLRRDVYISWEILESEAFKELSTSSIRILLRFLQKRTWHKGNGNGRKKITYANDGLSFTYGEAAVLGIKNTSFYEGIKRLVDVGFIDVDHQGGCYGKDYSRYSLSERWRDYGTDKFKKIEKRRSLQHGLDVRSNMQKKSKAPTGNRSYLLQETVVMREIQERQGIGNP